MASDIQGNDCYFCTHFRAIDRIGTIGRCSKIVGKVANTAKLKDSHVTVTGDFGCKFFEEETGDGQEEETMQNLRKLSCVVQ